jgi:hypothetical protein
MFLNCVALSNVCLKNCSDFFPSIIERVISVGKATAPKIVIKVNNVSIFLPQETLLMISYTYLLWVMSIKNVIFQCVIFL